MRNNEGKLVRISTNLEAQIIDYLINEEALGNGSSRIVFDFPAQFAAELNLPSDNNYIVKVAIGKAGINQMNQEIDVYEDYFDTGAFADIWAYGRYIEVMDKIDVQDFESFIDKNEDGTFDEDLQGRLEWLTEIANDITGETGDNCQNGFNNDGVLVIYDYGFDPALGCSHFCSNLREIIWQEGVQALYFKKLLELLEEDEFLMSSIRTVESEVLYEYDEDDKIYLDEEDEDDSEEEEEDDAEQESSHKIKKWLVVIRSKADNILYDTYGVFRRYNNARERYEEISNDGTIPEGCYADVESIGSLSDFYNDEAEDEYEEEGERFTDDPNNTGSQN